MKAVVLEIKNGYAAVLREDGVVVKIRRRCEVGETIWLSGKEANGVRQGSYARMIRNIAIAAAVVLVVLAGTSTYYLTATSAASVEVDTGGTMLMLSVNHFNRVIGISSDKEEDAELISAIDAEGIRNNTLEEALQKTAFVIRGRTQADEETAAEITIQTTSDRTYEQLRGQAEKGGFSVKRKGMADEGRRGGEEQEFKIAPMEENAFPQEQDIPDVSMEPEMRADIDEYTDMDEHAGTFGHNGWDEDAGMEERADTYEYNGWEKHAGMEEQVYGEDYSEETDRGQETGKDGMSSEDVNGRNEAAEQRGEDPGSEQVQEGESSGEETQNNAARGDSREEAVNDADRGDSQGGNGEGHAGMRP